MITVRKINNGVIEIAKRTRLITYKSDVLALVFNYFFHAEAGVVLTLFLNFAQK